MRTGNLRRAKLLLRQGVDTEARDAQGRTAIILASEHGRADVVRALLAGRADVSATDWAGQSAIEAAGLNSHWDVVALLAGGARPDTLYVAALIGDEPQVRRLLAQGQDTERRGPNGETALHWAARRGDAAIARLLLQHGADADARRDYDRWTPLDVAAACGHAELVSLLQAHSALG